MDLLTNESNTEEISERPCNTTNRETIQRIIIYSNVLYRNILRYNVILYYIILYNILYKIRSGLMRLILLVGTPKYVTESMDYQWTTSLNLGTNNALP